MIARKSWSMIYFISYFRSGHNILLVYMKYQVINHYGSKDYYEQINFSQGLSFNFKLEAVKFHLTSPANFPPILIYHNKNTI